MFTTEIQGQNYQFSLIEQEGLFMLSEIAGRTNPKLELSTA
jgi:hypothetical protein